MMKPIGSMLSDALSRARIEEQVSAARIMEEAQRAIHAVCETPVGSDLIVARSLHDGTLLVACKSAAAASVVKERAQALREQIVRALPTAPIHTIVPRLFSSTHQQIAWYDAPA
jgi:hypothetical protein